MMVGAATVFVVTDIAKSTEHYREVLGFPRLTGRGMRRFEFGSCLLMALSGRHARDRMMSAVEGKADIGMASAQVCL
jgi:hypothetical protein